MSTVWNSRYALRTFRIKSSTIRELLNGNDLAEGCRHMRLSFSHSAPEQIREGIRRLSVAVKMHLRSAHAPLEVASGKS
jgi:hypothetical protein